MAFDEKHNKLIFLTIISVLYLAIFFIFISKVEELFTKIVWVAIIGLGTSWFFCYMMEDKKKNIDRIRYLPIKIRGKKFSVTVFAITICLLKFFV